MIDLNSTYMREFFECSVSNKRPVRLYYKMNIVTPKRNQVRHGNKRAYGALHHSSLFTACKIRVPWKFGIF